MASEQKRVVPKRVIDNLSMLREAFAKEAFACSSLHHILVAHNDNLTTEVMYGPTGFVQPGMQISHMVQTPDRGPLEIISSDSMAVLQVPQWTDKGKMYKLEPMTFNWNPDARKEFISQPGVVVNGFLLSKWFDREIEHRRNRFQSLVTDVMACLDAIQSLPQLSAINIADPLNRRRGTKDSQARWMRIVHRLGWDCHALSLLSAKRQTWFRDNPKSIMFLPYESEELKPLLEHSVGPFQKMKERMTIPPDRFVSELGHDVFTESCYGIDDIFTLINEETLEQEFSNDLVNPQTERGIREKVFVSYSHADKTWLDDILQMLSPAIRKQTIEIWYDRKIKPGEIWRQEIERAMESARIGLLLVTPDFLASDFINDEELPYMMNKAAEGGVQILWIAVSHCLYEQTEIKKIQALNDPSKPLKGMGKPKRDKELKRICQTILKQYEELK